MFKVSWRLCGITYEDMQFKVNLAANSGWLNLSKRSDMNLSESLMVSSLVGISRAFFPMIIFLRTTFGIIQNLYIKKCVSSDVWLETEKIGVFTIELILCSWRWKCRQNCCTIWVIRFEDSGPFVQQTFELEIHPNLLQICEPYSIEDDPKVWSTQKRILSMSNRSAYNQFDT